MSKDLCNLDEALQSLWSAYKMTSIYDGFYIISYKTCSIKSTIIDKEAED